MFQLTELIFVSNLKNKGNGYLYCTCICANYWLFGNTVHKLSAIAIKPLLQLALAANSYYNPPAVCVHPPVPASDNLHEQNRN